MKNNKKKTTQLTTDYIDDFWTSVGIMQGRGNASVKTQRIKDLESGKINVFQATPKGESTLGLVLKGLIIGNK